MKLFQKLLLAPAALGLMAPVAASAADLNVAGVRQYTTSEEQVTSITQFSDVKPTDWAYQALSNLIERYGCVAGYPNGTYKGGQAMTRYEAAALLNACLDRVTEATDEVKRLVKEFEKELAVLKGRVDSVEAKVGQLEATQFSTTTKLSGLASFVLGATSFSGTNTARVTENETTLGGTSFNYDVRLTLNTSFTGKDLLRTKLRTGNFCTASAYCTGLTGLEAAGGSQVAATDSSRDVLAVSGIFYNFPIGSELSVTAGPKVHMTDPAMLGMWPSAYPADTVLDFFTYAGSPGTYNLLPAGGGGGIVYSPSSIKGLTFSQNYISGNAATSNPSDGGLGTHGASSVAATQIAYAGEKTPLIGGSYGLAASYTYSQNQALTLSAIGGQAEDASTGVINSYGLSGFWKPEAAGYIPSISWGFSTSQHSARVNTNTRRDVTSSWYTGLQWDDAFVKGNSLGMGVGQAPYLAKLAAGGTPDDSNYMWEWWYKFQMTDNISVMPAIYYISDYNGGGGKTGPNGSKTNSNAFGALVKTTFKF